jgi:hypothetical protein
MLPLPPDPGDTSSMLKGKFKKKRRAASGTSSQSPSKRASTSSSLTSGSVSTSLTSGSVSTSLTSGSVSSESSASGESEDAQFVAQLARVVGPGALGSMLREERRVAMDKEHNRLIELREEYFKVVGENWICSFINRKGEEDERWMPCKLKRVRKCQSRKSENGDDLWIKDPIPYDPKLAISELEKRIEMFKKTKIKAKEGGWKKFEGWKDVVHYRTKGVMRAKGTEKDFIPPPERERVVSATVPEKKPRKRGKKCRVGATCVFVGGVKHTLLKRPKRDNGKRDYNRCVVCTRQVDTYCAVCPSSGPRGKSGKTLCGRCFEGYHRGKLEDTKGKISL